MAYNMDMMKATHEEYDKWIDRWRFFRDSYEGGMEYRNGHWLSQFVTEGSALYRQRLKDAHLENKCSRVIDTYASFINNANVDREFGSIENDGVLDDFLDDADLDGRSFQSVIREAGKIAGIYGNAYIIVDKPGIEVDTVAQEQELGIWPYLSVLSPEVVMDWMYERLPNGRTVLTYLKVLQESNSRYDLYKIYTPDFTDTVKVKKMYDTDPAGNAAEEIVQIMESVPQALGEVPAVVMYNKTSPVRGIGVSNINDIADAQKAIYDYYSELLQLSKLSNYPTAVLEEGTELAPGPGSVAYVPKQEYIAGQVSPEPFKPYLMKTDGANISALLEVIENLSKSIDESSYLDAVTGQRSARSGVAIQTEMKLLNGKLAEMAANTRLAEMQIWTKWAKWQGNVWDGKITYPTSFDQRDRNQDLMNLKLANEIGVTNPALAEYIQKAIATAVVEDTEELEEIVDEIGEGAVPIINTSNNETEEIPETGEVL